MICFSSSGRGGRRGGTEARRRRFKVQGQEKKEKEEWKDKEKKRTVSYEKRPSESKG